MHYSDEFPSGRSPGSSTSLDCSLAGTLMTLCSLCFHFLERGASSLRGIRAVSFANNYTINPFCIAVRKYLKNSFQSNLILSTCIKKFDPRVKNNIVKISSNFFASLAVMLKHICRNFNSQEEYNLAIFNFVQQLYFAFFAELWENYFFFYSFQNIYILKYSF